MGGGVPRDELDESCVISRETQLHPQPMVAWTGINIGLEAVLLHVCSEQPRDTAVVRVVLSDGLREDLKCLPPFSTRPTRIDEGLLLKGCLDEWLVRILGAMLLVCDAESNGEADGSSRGK